MREERDYWRSSGFGEEVIREREGDKEKARAMQSWRERGEILTWTMIIIHLLIGQSILLSLYLNTKRNEG